MQGFTIQHKIQSVALGQLHGHGKPQLPHIRPLEGHRRHKTIRNQRAVAVLTPSRDVGSISAKSKASKLAQQNSAWLHLQDPFCRLPVSACRALAEAVQVEILLEGEKILRAEQRITDLILVRDGRLLGTEQPPTNSGAPPSGVLGC